MADSHAPALAHSQEPLPEPLFTRPYQSGITDPMWPRDYPGDIDPAALRNYLRHQMESGRLAEFDVEGAGEEELKRQYDDDYAGRVSRQKYQSILRADVVADRREDLRNALRLLTRFAVEEMGKKPSQKHVKLLEPIPDSYRVTITLAFGASLFVDKTGFDRFGLRALKPRFLKTMPRFEGDAPSLDPLAAASDLLLLVSSDHPYVNVAVLRYFCEYFERRFRESFPASGRSPILRFRSDIEQGFARKDKREYLKFDDGIDNIRMGPDELERLVYVDEYDNEPEWCRHGTYLVYRKIRENLTHWESFSDEQQEGFIGRQKTDGCPLSRDAVGPGKLTPVYPDPTDPRDGPLDAHIRKVQPRRPDPDLFGLRDLERRFLRRPYPFFDGLDERGDAVAGLQFVAFMKSIQQQYEHVANMWQLNPDFPVAGTGVDALYARGVLSNVDGGYYFCPPGLRNEDDYFGSGLFER